MNPTMVAMRFEYRWPGGNPDPDGGPRRVSRSEAVAAVRKGFPLSVYLVCGRKQIGLCLVYTKPDKRRFWWGSEHFRQDGAGQRCERLDARSVILSAERLLTRWSAEEDKQREGGA